MLSFRGKTRIVEKIPLARLPRELIASCRGLRYKLDMSDRLHRKIYFNLYDMQEVRQLLEFIPQNGVCLDVGAHVGFYTLHFAKRVGSGGSVFAFEPDPRNFARLSENARLNGFSSFVHAHQAAVTKRDGPVTFWQSTNSAWGSLTRFEDIAVMPISTEGITLDTFLSQSALKRVDVLKADVEAGEFELLEGAQASLRAGVFRSILIEFNGPRLSQRGRTFSEFLEVFSKNGFAPTGSSRDLVEQMKQGRISADTTIVNLLFRAQEAGPSVRDR